ncbi:alpha/beta hydrolase [Novosphingobium sp.]|uniref:alpha/beta hydrolase n=1 Tax=Novosphingobium sp. TaxID=1874826 RepID=UPI00286E9E57|nr:alpha/beta hydrolase [Novosphingobium sp.]
MTQLTTRLWGRCNEVVGNGGPLVIAIHGGTYTSGYFDLPGRSMLESGRANGIAVVAIDRPGYDATPMLAAEAMDIVGQAAFLHEELGEVWAAKGKGHSGVVLIGHSIGAAIAATVAASGPDWPLLGLAVSGVGLTSNPGDYERWASLPDIPLVAMPDEIKDMVMFGPEGSFDADMPSASHAANTTAPKAELLAITGVWHKEVLEVLERIGVPVHYRQAEFDRLWVVDQGEVDAFASALTVSPWVDARLVPGAGHCIDFHRVGPAFQLQQLGFALECAVR